MAHADPVEDPAAMNTFLICQATREAVSVLLRRRGVDELFAEHRGKCRLAGQE